MRFAEFFDMDPGVSGVAVVHAATRPRFIMARLRVDGT